MGRWEAVESSSEEDDDDIVTDGVREGNTVALSPL